MDENTGAEAVAAFYKTHHPPQVSWYPRHYERKIKQQTARYTVPRG